MLTATQGTPLDDAIRQKHDTVAAFLKSKGGMTGKEVRAEAVSKPPTISAADLCDAAFKGDIAQLRLCTATRPSKGRGPDYFFRGLKKYLGRPGGPSV